MMLTATRAGVECPRCGGQRFPEHVLHGVGEWDVSHPELVCIQCGHSEADMPLQVVEELAEELSRNAMPGRHRRIQTPIRNGMRL